jgi:hypothetical protein
MKLLKISDDEYKKWNKEIDEILKFQKMYLM